MTGDVHDCGVIMTDDVHDCGVIMTDDVHDCGVIMTGDVHDCGVIMTDDLHDCGVIMTDDLDAIDIIMMCGLYTCDVTMTTNWQWLGKATKNKCLGSHPKKIEKWQGWVIFFFWGGNWKINVLVLIRRKKRKMMRVSENTISSEKCMHFKCFPRLSIWRGAWLFFLCYKIRLGSWWKPRLFSLPNLKNCFSCFFYFAQICSSIQILKSWIFMFVYVPKVGWKMLNNGLIFKI